jgi:hypothetical protein
MPDINNLNEERLILDQGFQMLQSIVLGLCFWACGEVEYHRDWSVWRRRWLLTLWKTRSRELVRQGAPDKIQTPGQPVSVTYFLEVGPTS